MKQYFYITTPIYYANGSPHIGTAYTSLIADTIARIKRMSGYEVKFTTGTDENGQKMKLTAAENGKEVMEYLDEVADLHKSTRDEMEISYTDFIRTTHPTHKKFVQEALVKTKENGDIYKGVYEGLYCLGCEGFKKESDLIDHQGQMVCPDHLKKPDVIHENNWFFSLKNYQLFLEKLYDSNSDFCVPGYRFNEIQSFVKNGLDDFSISREGSDFGIPIPFKDDAESVVYIRFDALYNYVTTCMYPHSFTKNGLSVSGEKNDMCFWNSGNVIHTIGKDIGRFHAVFWPAMLQSAGFSIPTKEIINGFFTVDGQKMSKSLGNQIDPLDMIREYGRDALCYYFFNDIKIGNDGDFSRTRFLETKENILKKGRGNLVSRVVTLARKNEITHVDVSKNDLQGFDVIGEQYFGTVSNPLRERISDSYKYDQKIIIKECFDTYREEDLTILTSDWFQLVQLGNKFVDETKPWVVIKEGLGSQQEIDMKFSENKKNLQILLWFIKNIAILSAPILVDGFEKFKEIVDIVDFDGWHSLQTHENNQGIGDKWNEILSLQKFDTKLSETAHIY